MPSTVSLTQGTLKVADRVSNIHPEHWDPKVERQTPLDKYPMVLTLDTLPQAQPSSSRIHHWWDKPFNSMTGGLDDVCTNAGLGTAWSATGSAAGVQPYLKPTSADEYTLKNLRVGMQLNLYSSSVGKSIKGRITAVEPTGALPSITFKTLQADTNNVLTGTGLSWTALQKSNDEVYELGEATQEHESEFYNYFYTDDEPFAISFDEMDEMSRVDEDVRDEQEMDAKMRLDQRREYTFFEGWRDLSGTKYYTGGLRYFLTEHESSNIIDWKTDTTYSAATDDVVGGTLPFLKKLFVYQRKWMEPGSTVQMHVSATVWEILDRCVLHSGEYRITPGVNNYGINVGYLLGLKGQKIEIIENPLFEHYPEALNTAYIVVPDNCRRVPKNTKNSGQTFNKGICYVPWSKVKDMDGEDYISRIKGGWIAKESYQYRNLAANLIIDNLGLAKS